MSRTVAHQAPLSMEIFRQEHEWVAISFSRGSLDPGIKPASQARQADSLPWATREALTHRGRPPVPQGGRHTLRSPSQSAQVLTTMPGQAAHVQQEKLRQGPQGTNLSEQPFRHASPMVRHRLRVNSRPCSRGSVMSQGVFKRVTEEKGTEEDEVVGWHHWLNGHEFGDAQGGLACCSPRGHKESNTTDRLNWTELNRGGTFIWCQWWVLSVSCAWLTGRPCLKNWTQHLERKSSNSEPSLWEDKRLMYGRNQQNTVKQLSSN